MPTRLIYFFIYNILRDQLFKSKVNTIKQDTESLFQLLMNLKMNVYFLDIIFLIFNVITKYALLTQN